MPQGILADFVEVGRYRRELEYTAAQGFIRRGQARTPGPRVDVERKRREAFLSFCKRQARQPPKPTVSKYQRQKVRIQMLREARRAT